MVSNRESTHGESSKTSSLENPSCRLDPIVIRPESITLKMPPELEKVVPLWPNTRADKCIGNIKAKPMRKLSSNNYHSLYKCVERNKQMRAMRDNSFKTLDRAITHAYFKDLKKKQGVTIIEIGGYLGVLLPKLVATTGTKQYVALEPVPSFYQQLSKRIEDLSLQSRVTTYNFGLAKSKKELQISLRKDATSLLKDDKREGVQTETIKIFNVVDFFVMVDEPLTPESGRLIPPPTPPISMMNRKMLPKLQEVHEDDHKRKSRAKKNDTKSKFRSKSEERAKSGPASLTQNVVFQEDIASPSSHSAFSETSV